MPRPIFSNGSWKIIGNLIDWYIISSHDGLSLGNKMVWPAHEKVFINVPFHLIDGKGFINVTLKDDDHPRL
ncbi:hypothetical protein Bca4012_016825 [Brassica carinata]